MIQTVQGTEPGLTRNRAVSDAVQSAPIAPVARGKSIRNQVVQQITELIVSGALPAGTRLTEVGMAKRLGVSRVPVREAFLILQGDQWVDIQEAHGTKVHVPQPGEVNDIFEVRVSMESLAASLAAQHCTVEDAQDLKSLANEGRERHRLGDVAGTSRINALFHGRIVKISGNVILDRMLAQLELKTRMYFTARITRPRGVGAWDEHIAIAEAIASRDAAEAATLMRRHVLASWAEYRKLAGDGEEKDPVGLDTNEAKEAA